MAASLRSEVLALYRSALRSCARLPAARQTAARREARAAFTENRHVTSRSVVLKLLDVGRARLADLTRANAETGASSGGGGRTRFVVRDGKLVEVSEEPRARDPAKVRELWSTDIVHRHNALLARQKRLGM
eukprot:EG_transcript_32960